MVILVQAKTVRFSAVSFMILLAFAHVNIRSSVGDDVSVYAFIEPMAEVSFIYQKTCQEANISVSGVGVSKSKIVIAI